MNAIKSRKNHGFVAQCEGRRCVVITDLDGTLLDHATYSFESARPALQLLQREQVPVVFCSSKTASELTALQRRMGVQDPFIFENGGGICFPGSAGKRVELGRPVRELMECLAVIEEVLGLKLTALNEMDVEEIVACSGLSPVEAGRAKRREFSVPILPADGAAFDRLEEEAGRLGLRLIRGGRFLHLTGMSDKGAAVKRLVEILRHKWQTEVCTVGLGDSRNDLEMLNRVSIPVIIPNPQSRVPLRQEIPDAAVASQPGPKGWNEMILRLFSSSQG